MAFGGYKFKGYCVDNTKYASNTERCLPVHAARVRAFLEASALAGNPWIADNDWLNGEISIDLTTGTLTDNVSNGLIHKQYSPNNTLNGYSSYFKYSFGGVTGGYYYILTTSGYIGHSNETGTGHDEYITINGNSLIQHPKTSSSDSRYRVPMYASCFHCLSLEQFGNSLFNLIQLNSKSSRLQSVGFNQGTNGYDGQWNPTGGGGFLSYSGKVYFGYAIKGKDIIVLSGIGDTPFTGSAGNSCVVMSLDGFSELYNKNDEYPFLYLDIKNSGSYNSGESNSTGYKTSYDQVLSTTGQPLISLPISSSSTYPSMYLAYIIQDPRTYYHPSLASYTPLSGVVIGLRDTVNSKPPFSNSCQDVKGCTNPELIANNVSYTSLGSSMYNTVFNGNMMYLYSSSSSDRFPFFTYLTSSNFSKVNSFRGYTNFYIGWDPSNPDIRADAAWPEYSASNFS